MDENLKKEIIMEHYQNPINRNTIEDKSISSIHVSLFEFTFVYDLSSIVFLFIGF